MTKADTKIPFQFCHVCSNRRRTKKRKSKPSHEFGKARPSSEGKFFCVNRNWLWECDDCIEAHAMGQLDSPHERKLAEFLNDHRGIYGEVKRHEKLWNYEYDFAFPQVRLLVEIDGRSAHGPKQRYRDNLKDYAAKKNKWRLKRIRAVGNWISVFVQAYEKTRIFRKNARRAREVRRQRRSGRRFRKRA